MVSSFCDVVAYSDMRKRTFPTGREYPPKLWSKTPALRLEEIRMQAVENMVNIIRIYVLKVYTKLRLFYYPSYPRNHSVSYSSKKNE
jgi:hypothetical protein